MSTKNAGHYSSELLPSGAGPSNARASTGASEKCRKSFGVFLGPFSGFRKGFLGFAKAEGWW